MGLTSSHPVPTPSCKLCSRVRCSCACTLVVPSHSEMCYALAPLPFSWLGLFAELLYRLPTTQIALFGGLFVLRSGFVPRLRWHPRCRCSALGDSLHYQNFPSPHEQRYSTKHTRRPGARVAGEYRFRFLARMDRLRVDDMSNIVESRG